MSTTPRRKVKTPAKHSELTIQKAVQAFMTKGAAANTNLGPITVEGSVIGQGGNALVYPVDFCGPAVVKILLDDVGQGVSRKARRFFDEYRRLVRVPQHGSIVRLFHFDTLMINEYNLPAIIMERCKHSLARHWTPPKRPSPEDLQQFLEQICEALDRIHSHGIVHRDLKAENILVREDGTFCIADFGIAWFDPKAHHRSATSRTGERLANFKFSAPEQFAKKKTPVTGGADIYALGQLIYWAVTGETVRGTDFPSLASVDKSYAAFDPVAEKMLRQDPAMRPQSGAAVLQLLRGDPREKRKHQHRSHVRASLEELANRLGRALPGKPGISHLTDRTDIDRVLSVLGVEPPSYELWWTKGGKNHPVSKLIKFDDGLWLMDHEELDVTDLWVMRPPGKIDHAFVLLRSNARPPFGIYPSSEPGTEPRELAALFDGRWVNYDEYQDRHTIVDGAAVPLIGAEVRGRHLVPQYIFLATKFNPVLVPTPRSNADFVVDELIKKYANGGTVDEEELWGLRELEISTLYD